MHGGGGGEGGEAENVSKQMKSSGWRGVAGWRYFASVRRNCLTPGLGGGGRGRKGEKIRSEKVKLERRGLMGNSIIYSIFPVPSFPFLRLLFIFVSYIFYFKIYKFFFKIFSKFINFFFFVGQHPVAL